MRQTRGPLWNAIARACRVAGVTLLTIATLAAFGGGQAQARSVTTATVKSAPLKWSTPQQIDTNQNGLFSVSCPSVTFCVAVGFGPVGAAYIWNGASWTPSAPQLFAADGYNHIACPTTSFCMAGAPDGGALVWDGTSWSTGSQIRFPDPNDGITNVSCVSASFCAAPDEDGDIRVWNGTSWSIEYQVPAHSISCPTSTFCMAVGQTGNPVTWNGTSFSTPQVNTVPNLVSCPTPSFCMAVGVSSFSAWKGSSWTAPKPPNPPPRPTGPPKRRKRSPPPTHPVGTIGPPMVQMNWVSCPTVTFCVAVIANGTAIEWHGGVSWSTPVSIDQNLASVIGPTGNVNGNNSSGPAGLSSVSCPTPTFCVAVGSDGDVEIGQRTG